MLIYRNYAKLVQREKQIMNTLYTQKNDKIEAIDD